MFLQHFPSRIMGVTVSPVDDLRAKELRPLLGPWLSMGFQLCRETTGGLPSMMNVELPGNSKQISQVCKVRSLRRLESLKKQHGMFLHRRKEGSISR